MDTRAWILERRPAAPGGLRDAMLATLQPSVESEAATSAPVSASPVPASPVPDDTTTPKETGVLGQGHVGWLLRATTGELLRARSQPGRVRESAFALLGADGLLTHACEGALEADGLQSDGPASDHLKSDHLKSVRPQLGAPEAALRRLASEVAAP